MTRTSALVLPVMLAFVCSMTPRIARAQVVTAQDRDALVRLSTDRGGKTDDVDALIRLANESAAKGLPSVWLTNKIREGLAKGVDPKRIDPVVRKMATELEQSDRLLREFSLPAGPSSRDSSVILMAEAIDAGLTPDDIRELRRQSQSPATSTSRGSVSSATDEGLASAAKGLSSVKEAQLTIAEGTPVMAEAVRHGYRSQELLELGREIKRREADYRSGRASLRSLRDAIARGDRPDQLFKDSRPATPERPAVTRPETPADRPTRPEAPTRPEPPARPGR